LASTDAGKAGRRTGGGRQDEEVAMTWDVYVSGDDRSWEAGDGVAEVDGSLGSESDVRRQVDDVWPGTTWDDRTGWVEREDVVAEVVLAAGDPVGSLTVAVRGGSNPVQAVLDLCRRSGWTPLDFSTGRVLTVQENGYGWWLELQEGAGQPLEPVKPAPAPGRRRWGWRR
jgi:hypothetical protein